MLLYIIKRWFPCRNRQECAEQAQLFQEQMLVALQVGGQQLHALLSTTPHSITASDQAVEQIAAAGFSYREVVGAVRQGLLIEWVEGITSRPDLAVDEYASTILVIRGEIGGGVGADAGTCACCSPMTRRAARTGASGAVTTPVAPASAHRKTSRRTRPSAGGSGCALP